jgi:hypothetical protein
MTIRPSGIPAHWTAKTTRKGGGVQYINPENSHDRVRVMPGNPASPNLAQQVPYVKRMKDGTALDRFGNPVPSNSVKAHIPLTDFIFFP